MFAGFGRTTVRKDRQGDCRQRLSPTPRCCEWPRVAEPKRRTLRSLSLLGVLMIGGLVGLATTTIRADGPAKGNTGSVTRELLGRLDNNFSTTTPPPLLTIAISGGGHATVLGKVTDSFTAIVDFNHPVADGFVLVSKTGSLVAADGDRVDLSMVGTFNVATLDVHYVFVVTGGTGRFAGATGNGTWDVPPPAVFDAATGSGSGAEFFKGKITLSRHD